MARCPHALPHHSTLVTAISGPPAITMSLDGQRKVRPYHGIMSWPLLIALGIILSPPSTPDTLPSPRLRQRKSLGSKWLFSPAQSRSRTVAKPVHLQDVLFLWPTPRSPPVSSSRLSTVLLGVAPPCPGSAKARNPRIPLAH